MTFSVAVLAFIFIFGLVIGSFLNVVILRTVSGESIVFPASKCPKCGTPLKWYHNIPVLSYIFLRGKCGFCHEHISWQYPLVELFTGIIFVLLFLKCCAPFDSMFGLEVMNPISWYQAAIYAVSLIASCLFIAIAGTDIIEKKVSDAHTYSLIGLGLGYSIIYSIVTLILLKKEFGTLHFTKEFILSCPILYSLGCAIIGFLIIEIIAQLGRLIVGTRAFGEGDSYISCGMGALFGALVGISPIYEGDFMAAFYALISVLVVSVIVQIIITIPLFIKKLIQEKNIITLGAITGFVLYAIGFFFALSAGWLDNKAAYWVSTIVLAAIGIFTCRELLLGVRKSNGENGLYLPFGPAMVIAGFICLFVFPL